MHGTNYHLYAGSNLSNLGTIPVYAGSNLSNLGTIPVWPVFRRARA
jgi:hypothetical protein